MRIPYRVLPQDGVLTLTGPVRGHVTVEAKHTTRSATGEETQFEPVFSYTLDVPPGHTWKLPTDRADVLTSVFGGNDGVRVIVDPVLGVRDLVPPVLSTSDIPCDLAVAEVDGEACGGPRPCDPLPEGAMIAMPAEMPALVTIPARGGLVRPRYFNGLFLTSAELATEQRRRRTEQRLQNRAHGAGVVWGLVPVFDGQSIKVSVGYGVDCCGNDLLVTAPYVVPADVLLADTTKQFTRMHLLLEYVEVPEAPRPAHDECAPGITRTEPSRVRETVRLRLVQPRDFDARGPIDDLLATGLLDSDRSAPQKEVPFDLWVKTASNTYDFVIGLDQKQIVLAGAFNGSDYEARPKSGWTLSTAKVFFDDPNDPAPAAQIASLDASTGTAKWHINGRFAKMWVEWTARRTGVRGTFSGTTHFDLFVEIDTQEERLTVDPTSIALTPDPPGPCYHEPCDPQNPRFPTQPPWLHGFPGATDLAADPRALQLALSELGLGDSIDMDASTRDAIRDLAKAWSESLLWPGPTCLERAPHGIVIGCVQLKDGRIADVDAWGGRRWVMRAGLIEHIATQAGVLPPGVLASRLAGLASCAAKQRVPDLPPPVIIERVENTDAVAIRTARALAARTPPLPPLIRGFANHFASAISRGIPVETLETIEAPMTGQLRAAGVTMVGQLLVRDAEELLASVGSEHATSLARVLTAAEMRVDAVAKAVGDVLVTIRAESRATLDRVKLLKALMPALKDVGRPAVEAALDQTMRS